MIDFDAVQEESERVNGLVELIAEEIIGLSKLGLDPELNEAVKFALLDAYFCGKNTNRKPGQFKNNWSQFINSNLK